MIEVGEYVRCKNGRIAKVESIDKNFIYFDAEIYRQNGIAMHECETWIIILKIMEIKQ